VAKRAWGRHFFEIDPSTRFPSDGKLYKGSGTGVPLLSLDEGLHAEIEIDLPGWTERLLIPYPAAAGDVRRAVRRLLQDPGLVDEVETFHLLEGRAATDR
jgi:hypothetical protein